MKMYNITPFSDYHAIIRAKRHIEQIVDDNAPSKSRKIIMITIIIMRAYVVKKREQIAYFIILLHCRMGNNVLGFSFDLNSHKYRNRLVLLRLVLRIHTAVLGPGYLNANVTPLLPWPPTKSRKIYYTRISSEGVCVGYPPEKRIDYTPAG